jgi:HlyD family secretion protein
LEGQTVKRGDVLARLVDDDAKLTLKYAEAELHHKKGHLAILNATHRAALSDWEHPIERERAVSTAEAALAEARSELARIPHDIATEEARQKELEEQLRREDKAAEANAIPEFQRTQTRLKLNTQRAVLESSRERKGVQEAKVRQMEADLKAARENLRLRINEKRAVEESDAGVCESEGQVKMMEIAVEKARLHFSRMEVRSPADGVVMQRLAEPGGKVMMLMDDKASSQIARLYDPKKLQVRVDVPLAEAARVGVGQEARVTVEVLRERTFKGTVTRVVNEADIQKNTLQVKVALTDPVPELKPEMLARVQFVAGAKTGGSKSTDMRLFAQEKALQKNGERGTAWIVDKGRGVATRREVTLGSARIDGWIEVTQGLQPGDAVIAGDTSALKEGQSVRIVEETDGAGAADNKGGAHGSH